MTIPSQTEILILSRSKTFFLALHIFSLILSHHLLLIKSYFSSLPLSLSRFFKNIWQQTCLKIFFGKFTSEMFLRLFEKLLRKVVPELNLNADVRVLFSLIQRDSNLILKGFHSNCGPVHLTASSRTKLKWKVAGSSPSGWRKSQLLRGAGCHHIERVIAG